MEIDKYFNFYLKALLHFVPPPSSVPYCIEMWKKVSIEQKSILPGATQLSDQEKTTHPFIIANVQ